MNNPIHPYEPLTSENAALVLVDHQVGLMTGVRDYSTGELKHNVVALAKAATALNLPIIVTTTARESMWGPTFPELVEALPGVQIIDRSSVNAFDDERVASAIMGTGRKKLIFAGISLEVCAAFPAITAVGKGLDAYVAVDASGTFSETKRQAGLLRMQQAGVILSDYATLMVEILKDNARPEAGAVYGAIDMPWAKLVGQMVTTKENVVKGEREITVPAADLKWEDMAPGSPVKMSVLWGDHKKGPFGMLLKQPGGFEAGMHTHATDYHAVLVQGTWIHTVEGDSSAPKELTPGSYVFQPAWQMHNEEFKGPEDSIVYIHQLGKADFIPFKGAGPAEKE